MPENQDQHSKKYHLDPEISVRAFLGGMDNNFTYMIRHEITGSCLLIDAAIPYSMISSRWDSPPDLLLITHTHADHIAYGKDYLYQIPDLTVIMHQHSVSHFEYPQIQSVSDGDELHLGPIPIQILHTPGHYPDSVCYRIGNGLFTGDTVFIGRTGRTISPRSDTRQLYRSIRDKILSLPGHIRIFPGHDYGSQPTMTLQENIKLSPLLKARDEDDFVQRMAAYEASRKST